MSIAPRLVRRSGMATRLLNDDDTASMATAMMSSHHAFRRDLACFADALAAIAAGDASRAAAVVGEWTSFCATLHGHHSHEDAGLFPDLRAKQPELAADIDRLQAQHHRIDPLLEGATAAITASQYGDALAIVRELAAVLAEHLDLEERVAIPHLRGAREFPPPPTDEVAAMYAEGFAWSTGGLAPVVVAAIDAILPPSVIALLPAARRAFDERCLRVWGRVHDGASQTSA
jgi:hemerythrin-like domain-containing protein